MDWEGLRDERAALPYCLVMGVNTSGTFGRLQVTPGQMDKRRNNQHQPAPTETMFNFTDVRGMKTNDLTNTTPHPRSRLTGVQRGVVLGGVEKRSRWGGKVRKGARG